MNTIFVIKTIFKTALILLKVVAILHLRATEDLIIFTLVFNVLVFLRALIQRALTWLALRALRTKWQRLTVFLLHLLSFRP